MDFPLRAIRYWRRLASRVAPLKITESMLRRKDKNKTIGVTQQEQNEAYSNVDISAIEEARETLTGNLGTSNWPFVQCRSGRSGIIEATTTGTNQPFFCKREQKIEEKVTIITVSSSEDDIQEITSSQKELTEHNPTYLETYLKLMYLLCWSPFLPEGASSGVWSKTKVLYFVQLGAYFLLTCLTIVQTLILAKINCIFYMHEGGLENFTDMGFYIMNACTRIYTAYLFSLQPKKFSNMLYSIVRLRVFTQKYSKVKEPTYHTNKVVILVLVSITVSVLSVVFNIGVTEWSLSKELLDSSYRISAGIMIWSPNDLSSNSTVLDKLQADYGEVLCARNLLLGIVALIMNLANRIFTTAMGDLILMLAITLKMLLVPLTSEVNSCVNDIQLITMRNFETETGQWVHFQLLKKAVDDINNTFDSLLKYMHVDNVTIFVFLVLNAFDGELSSFTIIYFLYNLIRTSCTYRIATTISEKNETLLKWIRRLAWKSADTQFVTKAYLIMNELEKEPLGLGKGQFMIDESFMFRFLGTVGSVFVLQAQSREST